MMKKIKKIHTNEVFFLSTVVLVTVAVIVSVWFFTPVPTIAARYVWERYHAGDLALALDREDAHLAFAIGTYYFGNQGIVNDGQPPYELGLAEHALEKAIALEPSIRFAHYTLARIEFVKSAFDKALADLDAELALYPTNKRPLYMRGLTYTYRGSPGDLALAEADFRAFVAWAPREWAGYNDLAYVLAKETRYADAAAVLKEGIAKADAGNPWLWNTLGVMELNLKKPAAALSSFEKAQALAATLTDLNWQRAYPGNSPALAHDGLEAFQSGIAANIAAAQRAIDVK